MNSSTILSLLESKHAKDVFVAECKSGSTWYSNHLRLDGWAMNRSWRHMMFDGYEIKVSRADFTHDQKMEKYLPLCNRLWVVCPAKLLNPEEIPTDIGLIWAYPTRLLTKKRASVRDIDPPVDLLLYILMCRAKGMSRQDLHDGEGRTTKPADVWESYLADKLKLKDLGYQVGKKIQRQIRETLAEADRKLVAAKALEQNYPDVAKWLADHNIDPASHKYSFQNRLADTLVAEQGREIRRSIEYLQEQLARTKNTLWPEKKA